MVVGTLSLVQKGQTSGCSGCSMQWNSGMWWWGHCLWCKKVKPENAVDTVRSGIVVCGGGDIVFGAKRPNQRMQWMQYAVRSGIVVYGGGDIVFGAKKVKPVDAVCNGIVVYDGGDIVFGAKRSNQRMQRMQYAVE